MEVTIRNRQDRMEYVHTYIQRVMVLLPIMPSAWFWSNQLRQADGIDSFSCHEKTLSKQLEKKGKKAKGR